MGPLDRVFVRGGLHETQHYTARMELAREASDHLPVIVEFAWASR
jgi:endonuclease/exonuclease/phosphatase family metal-dependent hydrolase